MSEHLIHVVIESGPILERAIAYRKAEHEASKEWFALAKEFGADGFSSPLPGRPPTNFIFNSGNTKPPAGWVKVDRRGRSHPKKKHPDLERIEALPPAPSRWDVYGDDIISSVSHTGPGHEGSFSAMGLMFEPQIGWAGDTFLGIIPDAAKAAAYHLKNHPEDTITNGADTWVLPEGLRLISKAQMELIFAQHKVDQEKKKEDDG